MWIALATTCHLFWDKTYLQTGDTCSWWLPHFPSSYAIHTDAFKPVYIYISYINLNISLILPPLDFYRNFMTTTMETADYWLMAWEYSIWNAAIASLQFWTEDLDPVTLSIATEHIYTTFFWTSTSHTLCQQSEETLFGCLVIALNTAFTPQLSLADEGYESGSDTIDLPTPLWKIPHIHHVSSMEHASFNLVSTTPCSTVTITPCSMPQIPPRPVHRCLSFSFDNNQDPDNTPVYSNRSNDKEDFQMVPLDDEHWKKCLKELFVYTNRDYHITYANIHPLMAVITSLHTETV